MDDEIKAIIPGIFIGFAISILAFSVWFLSLETACEELHDVYDCERSDQMYQPVIRQ